MTSHFSVISDESEIMDRAESRAQMAASRAERGRSADRGSEIDTPILDRMEEYRDLTESKEIGSLTVGEVEEEEEDEEVYRTYFNKLVENITLEERIRTES